MNRQVVGRKAKRKGSDFERRVANALASATGLVFHRTPISGGSKLAKDYKLAGDVVTISSSWPFCVEVKAREDWCLEQLFSPTCVVWRWWNQAVSQATELGLSPLLVFKRNNYGPYTMLYACDAEKLGLTEVLLYKDIAICLFSHFLEVIKLSRKEAIDGRAG